MSIQQFPRTAIVVETNFLIASVIEAPLVSAGYRVLIATEPEEAFALMDAHEVHLALIDFRLHHAEPEGLVAKLKQRGIPFIFCTAASVEEVFEHFPDARVMEKPFSDDELLAAVAAMVAAEGSYHGA
ncbi:MAG: response regulator [Hyphomicrobiales bacterium]|nr:MAG: response regulator [Hyphomicrobiales bacterium]